jgi:hypothetical protein
MTAGGFGLGRSNPPGLGAEPNTTSSEAGAGSERAAPSESRQEGFPPSRTLRASAGAGPTVGGKDQPLPPNPQAGVWGRAPRARPAKLARGVGAARAPSAHSSREVR